METNNIYVHFDHNGQDIKNYSIERVSVHPSGGDLYEGREWVLTTTNRKYRYNGTDVVLMAEESDVIRTFSTATAANFSAITGSSIIYCDTTSNDVTIDLPTAATSAGLKYVIKRISGTTNNVIIDANGSELIDGESTIVMYDQYDSLTVHCDGNQWYVII